ncbi:MAG: PEP/pyruvate-binding domain-containing protein [Solirubrobacteraceae bacterium]
MIGPVALRDAVDPRVFGGKAAQLARAAEAGLPIPPGVALAWMFAEAVADGDPDAWPRLAAWAPPLGSSLAVRSSAVGEDSETASFAGQHLSVLGVLPAGLATAVKAVARSVCSQPALDYRQRLGVAGAPRAGVVIQRMVEADVAGVLFHPHPVTGADEIVIEAAWGLGEAVVGGLVTPDLFRLSPAGDVLERRTGMKDIEVVTVAAGGTAATPTSSDRARELCLDEPRLARLHRLATRCRRVFGGSQDLEWAFAGQRLWLLQRRAVTVRVIASEDRR